MSEVAGFVGQIRNRTSPVGRRSRAVTCMNEKIAFAAIRAGERIWLGTVHIKAEVAVLHDANLSGTEKERILMDKVDGFLTNTARFVFREEAFEIAKAAGQMIQHELADDPWRNMDVYGGDKPRLDSGLIKNYAPMCVPLENRCMVAE